MLNIVRAPQCGGKTEYLLEEMEKRARQGQKCLLVVSQQVSFEYERIITERFAPSVQRQITVRSFESLARDIFKLYGGAAVKRLSDSTRCAALRRAINAVGDSISFFGRHKQNEAFYRMAVAEFTRFTEAGIKPEDLKQLEGQTDDPILKVKLKESAAIYGAYIAVISGSYLDEQGAAEAAAQLVKKKYFEGVAVFLDEFDSFTYPQLKLIRRMMSSAESIFCTLTLREGSSPVLRQPGNTRRRLLGMAAEESIKAREITTDYKRPKGLSQLSDYLLFREKPETAEGIYFSRPATPYDEAALVASEICRLLRQGRAPSDMAVLLGDKSRYAMPVKIEFERYGIPAFNDFDRGISDSPAVAVCLSLLNMGENKRLDTESLLTIAKSGLCALPPESAELLQNYTFVWQTEGDSWLSPFTANPDGFRDGFTPQQTEALAACEQARRLLMEVSLAFVEAAEGADGEELVALLYKAMKEIGCSETLKKGAESGQGNDAALVQISRAVREYNIFCQVLDSLHALLTGDRLSCSDLAGLIRTEAASVRLYDIPEALEQVSVGGAERSRPIRKKIVFVLGVNEGVFPPDPASSGLFTDSEREMLSQRGELHNTISYRYHDGLLQFYRALCCPLERLYITSPMADSKGGSLSLPSQLGDYLEAVTPEPFPEEDSYPLIQNRESARLVLASRPGLAIELLGESPAPTEPNFSVENLEAISALLGGDMHISPSRIECFSSCAFKYFSRYVMGLSPIEEAKLDSREFGNLMHHLLQITMEGNSNFADLSPNQLRVEVDRAAEKYIRDNMTAIPTERLRYMTTRLCEQAVRLLIGIQKEQSESLFKARDYELRVARDGDIMPRTLPIDGGVATVSGVVDRVDVMHSDDGNVDFLRVVDYKSGSKTFSLPEVYYGISAQMFLYLSSICENGRDRYGNPQPAGVYYLRTEGHQEEGELTFDLDGVTILDYRLFPHNEQGETVGEDEKWEKYKELLKKDSAFASAEKLRKISEHIDGLVVDMCNDIKKGKFSPNPLAVDRKRNPCELCDYRGMCFSRKIKCRELEKTPETMFEGGENSPEGSQIGEGSEN